MVKKVLVFTGIVIAFLLFAYLFSTKFAPGSYPYAETYVLNIKENDLIREVALFKKNNPEYYVPKQVGLIDGRTDSSDHWYHIYFYYPEERQIIYTWIRGENMNETKFAFVSINNGLTLGKWKDINKDFSGDDNKKQIKKFEQLILNKIKDQMIK